MYFTPQQLSGGPRYTHKTRVGNWSEDFDAHTGKVRDYMAKKDYNSLSLTATQQKFAKALQRVSLFSFFPEQSYGFL